MGPWWPCACLWRVVVAGPVGWGRGVSSVSMGLPAFLGAMGAMGLGRGGPVYLVDMNGELN